MGGLFSGGLIFGRAYFREGLFLGGAYFREGLFLGGLLWEFYGIVIIIFGGGLIFGRAYFWGAYYGNFTVSLLSYEERNLD